MEMLSKLMGVQLGKMSKEKLLVLEAEIFFRVYDEIKQLIKKENKSYFDLMKFDNEMENKMIEDNFIRCLINDILATGEYSLEGMACYTQIPEDVLYEVAAGRNNNPSIILSQKIIGLHRSVRPSLYHDIIKKITADISTAA